jgi:hypothetical protein
MSNTNFKLHPPKKRSQTKAGKKKITETDMNNKVVSNTQSTDMDIDDISMQVDPVVPSKKVKIKKINLFSASFLFFFFKKN